MADKVAEVEEASPVVAARASDLSRWYALGVLVLALIVCNIDRNIIAVLLEPIKAEFKLQDWQLGLLAGLTFTTFYCIGTLFVARAADRLDRVWIVSLALFVWSSFTLLCGQAASFLQLALARAGVGLAESGSHAPSHSLIADYFKGEQRPLAMGIYSAGALVGVLIALPIGGVATQAFGWRGALVLVSLPGLLLAVIMRLSMRDPRKVGGARPPSPATQLSVVRGLLSDPVVRNLIAGATLVNLAGAAILSFGVSILIRARGLSGAEAGAVMGFFNGAFAIVGTIGSGWLVGRLCRRDHRWRAWLTAIALLIAPVFQAGFVLLPDTRMAILCSGLSSLFYTVWMAPTFSALQDAAGADRRATAAALLLVSYNFLGFGLGPLAAGIVSDLLTPQFGLGALGLSILALQPFSVWASFHFFRAAKCMVEPEPA